LEHMSEEDRDLLLNVTGNVLRKKA
jgi:hypothetical protein